MPPGSYIGVSPTNSRWFPVFCPRCVPRAKKWRCVVRGQQPGFVKIYPYSLRVQINITCAFKILTFQKRQKKWNWSQNVTIYHKDIQMLLFVSPVGIPHSPWKQVSIKPIRRRLLRHIRIQPAVRDGLDLLLLPRFLTLHWCCLRLYMLWHHDFSGHSIGECLTKLRGRYWCYVNPNSLCSDKTRSSRSSAAIKLYYSYDACSHQAEPQAATGGKWTLLRFWNVNPLYKT